MLAADGTVLIEAGATYDEAIIDAILANGTVRDVKVRNNAIEGIEIESITEGKNKQTVIESLRDRIVGRYLAEDILDNDGNIVTISMIMLLKIWRIRLLRCVKK